MKGKTLIELPYTVKGMDVSFGGLLTNLKHKHHDGHKNADLAYSCQETAFAMLIEIAERALAHCNKKELLLSSAGHEPPIIFSKDGSFSNYTEAGPPLGIIP